MKVGPSRKDYAAVFAADLHLQARDRGGLERAVRLLAHCRERTHHLYLLGDLFDLWTSAALLQMPEMQELFAAFRGAAEAGLRMTFLPGNRDFNLTPAVGRNLGLEVVGEALVVEQGGNSVYLSHGDEYLLRDRGYQRLKRVLRSAPLRFLARHLPSSVALAAARRIRRYSDRVVPAKRPERLAIVAAAVEARLARGHQVAICGHVHRAERVDYGSGRCLLVLPAFLEESRFAVWREGAWWLVDLEGGLHEFPQASRETAFTHGATPPR